MFYEVENLLQEMCTSPTPTCEAGIRERLILLLRILCLYRGCDLAGAVRKVRSEKQPWMIFMKRKGRPKASWYPIPHINPPACDPQHWLVTYMALTQDYAQPELFCSLRNAGPRKPICSDTINSITTAYLHARGLQDWTAHSTRGAAATALIKRGVPPAIVQALGDWQSHDCFMKFYNRVACTNQPFAQCLVPKGTSNANDASSSTTLALCGSTAS